MASIAGTVSEVGGCREARCFREKRARKRRARGSDSEVRMERSWVTWVSAVILEDWVGLKGVCVCRRRENGRKGNFGADCE